MRNRGKGIVVLGVIVCLGMLGVVGCNRDKEQGAGNAAVEKEPAWIELADEPVSLDWYINFSWFTSDWGSNLVSQKITEETGVSINFIAPAGSESEKLNSMISTDSLPDIVTLGWWEEQVQDMINAGLVYALNELADDYDPYFFQVADGTIVDWYTQEDGNIYGYPNSSYTPEDYGTYDNIGSNQTFLVRKDIYEAIGSPDMTTPEGFTAAIEKAAEMFPEIDGEPLIPIGSDEFTAGGCNSFDLYLQNFLAVPYEENGEYYDRYTDSDYIAWLKTFRELNEKGYLAEDIFIDKRAQLEEKAAKGRYFCILYQRTDIIDQQKTLYENDQDSIFIAVDGPKNSSGSDHRLPGSGINGWTLTFISKNCDNPERAIAFLSYLISEQGQKLTYIGVEGEMYDVIDGKCVVKPEVLTLLNTDRAAYNKLYGADSTYWMLQDNVMQFQWAQEQQDYIVQLEEWTYPYTIYTGQYDVIYAAGSDEADIYSKISTEWGNTLPNLLLAASEEEFDEILNQFIEKRETFGYPKLQIEATRQMIALKEKLGIE